MKKERDVCRLSQPVRRKEIVRFKVLVVLPVDESEFEGIVSKNGCVWEGRMVCVLADNLRVGCTKHDRRSS
jgi:hypothetical protein